MARRQREYNGKVYSDDGNGNLFNEETGKYLIYRPYPMLVDKVNPLDKIEPDNKQEYTSKQLKDKFGTDDTELINAGKEKEDQVVKVEDKKSKLYSYLDDDIDRDFPELSKKVTDKFDASLQQAANELGYDVNTNDGKEFMEISNRAKEIRENETRADLYRKQVLGNADEATDAANELARREADYIREVSNARNENELMDVDKKYADVVQSNLEAKSRRENEHPQNLISEIKNYKQKDSDEAVTAKERFLGRMNNAYNRNSEEFMNEMKNVRILEESEDYLLYANKFEDGQVWMSLMSSYDPKSRFQEMPNLYYMEDYQGRIKKGSVQVNWAAYGSVSPDKAKEFASKIQKAVDFAEKLNQGKDYSDLWR